MCQLELWLPSRGIYKAKLMGPDIVVGRSGRHILGNDSLGVDVGKAGQLWHSVLAGR